MFGDRPAAQRPSSAHAWNPNVCVLGKLPSRPDFVHYGLHEEPERVFRAWLEHAVLIAGGVLPNRAVRFIAAPRRTPVFGVWIPSQDSLGRPFPLVFVRRLARSDNDPRRTQREPRALGDLPWTLLLAGCSHYLTAAESCLMLGRASSIAELWSQLETLSLPRRRDLTELWVESKRALEFERLEVFAWRNLSEAGNCDAFVSAVRRLRSGDSSASQDAAMLALPAEHELDLFAWLELLRVQRPPEATPKAMFWSPADKRALVSLGAPLPGTLAFLRQPRLKSVHRFPMLSEPDESPAVEAELRNLIKTHPTLGKLRTALSPTREEPEADASQEEKAHSSRSTTATTETAARTVPTAPPQEPAPQEASRARPKREDHYEPPPIYKFRCVPAPDSHFTPEELHQFQRMDCARQHHAPQTEPLSGSFAPENRSRTERIEVAAEHARSQLRFRIPDPPINLSDTDAIEYVFAMVQERDLVAQAQREQERAAHEAPNIRGQQARSNPDSSVRVLQPITVVGRPTCDDGASGERVIDERCERELAIERLEAELRSRARAISLQEVALQQRELELARQEHALRARVHAVLRHAATKHAPEPPTKPAAPSDPDTTSVRILEPVTLIDDGSIAAARVLMTDSSSDRPSTSQDRARPQRSHRPASRSPRSLASC
jgi:type VI secretion system ImpM family protein